MEEHKPGDYCDKENCYSFRPCPFHQPPKTKMDHDYEPEPAFDLFGDERPLGNAGTVAVRSNTGYVGIHNMGATCYLNSLLQSLFVTQEFRDALFGWTYNPQKNGSTEFSIPFQLQLLFARLAHSSRSAVDTKDLTHSFRWSNAESFRQHDIQELLRVLFEALEKTVGPRINELYQGTVIDYLTCQRCGRERQRKDTFLDLSLDISQSSTLEHALRQYVTPEMLTGANQYRCEQCAQKVDAAKGFRFDSLPRVLAIHLKRFVYDLNRGTRVKENKSVTFPLSINMKSYFQDPSSLSSSNITSSSSASSASSASVTTSTTNDTDTVSSSSSSSSVSDVSSKTAAASPSLSNPSQESPDMWYDLLAVMLHSGTPVGGHYFAYIKCPPKRPNSRSSSRSSVTSASLPSTTDNTSSSSSSFFASTTTSDTCTSSSSSTETSSSSSSSSTTSSDSSSASLAWMEFNDSVIVPLGGDDPLRAAYGGTSSLSAYMLIYHQRQTDSTNLNVSVPVPEAVRSVIDSEDVKYAEEQKALELERRTMDVAVVFQNQTHTYRFDQDLTLGMVQETIRSNLAPSLPPDQVRLREFAVGAAWAQQPLEGKDALTLSQCGFRKMNHLILETREAHEQFPLYDPEEIPVRVVIATPANRQSLVDEALYPTAKSCAEHWNINIKGKVSDAQATLAPLLGAEPHNINVIRLSHNRAELLDPKYSIDYYDVKPSSVLYIELKMSDLEHKELNGEEQEEPMEEGVAEGDTTGSEHAAAAITTDTATSATTLAASVPIVKAAMMPPSALIRQFEFSRCQVSIGFNIPSAGELAPTYDQVLRVSKLQSLRVLKNLIASVIQIPMDDFRLRRSANGAHLKDLSATLDSYHLIDGSVVHVELGCALNKNEYLIQLFLYDATKPDKKQFMHLLDHPIDASLKVSVLKESLLQLLNQRFESKEDPSGNTFGIKHLRLRQKNRIDVGKIFEDTKSLKAQFPGLDDGKPIALQGIPMAENMSSLHRPIFLQHYNSVVPSVGSKIEVILKREAKVIDLKTMLMDISGIKRLEDLGMAKGPTLQALSVKQAATLVYDDPKLLNDGLLKMEPWHLRDNFVVVYTDLSLLPTRSIPEQKATTKPKSKFGTAQYTTPKARPEVAMKIYVDENEATFAADMKKALAASNAEVQKAAELSQNTDSVSKNSAHAVGTQIGAEVLPQTSLDNSNDSNSKTLM